MIFRQYYLFGFDVETLENVEQKTITTNYYSLEYEEREHKFYSFQLFSVLNNKEIKLISYDINDFVNLHKKLNLKKWNKNRKLKIVLVSHNAEFDTSVIIKSLDEKNINYDIKIRYNKSNFLRASFYFSNKKSPDVIILDLMNFTGRKSLEEIAKKFGLEKLKKPHFLGKRKWKNEKEKEIFEKYALNDAKICYHIFAKILNVSQQYSKIKTLPLSASSLALKLFLSKNKLPKYDNKFDALVYQVFRGGRTECFYRGLINCINFDKIYHYDFNSLYPFVMYKYQYPNTEKIIKRCLDFDYEGLAIATVKLEHDYIGALGIKKQINGYEKLIFPIGNKIRGQFTFAELKFIEENNLGKVEKVISAFAFETIESPFKNFVEFFYNLRKQQEFNYIAKLIMNSLFGKLGTKLYNVYVEKLSKNVNPKDLVGKIVDWEYSPNLARKIIEKMKYVGYNPILASYITAYGRIELTKLLLDVHDKGKQIFYCDTDSVITNCKLENSNEIGKLKLENVYEKVILIRSKSYIAYDLENNQIIKFKGIPKNSQISTIKDELNKFYNVENVEKNHLVAKYNKILNLREALHRNKKILQIINEKRIIDISSDGKRIYEKEFKSFDDFKNDYCNSKPLKF